MSAQPRLITVHEAAALLGVSPSRVRQFYGPTGPLHKYTNDLTHALRLDLDEVQALARLRATFRSTAKISA